MRKVLIWSLLSLLVVACGPGSGEFIKVNEAPVAQFSTHITDLLVNFDASASSDPDGSILTYFWDFGDGSSGETKQITHTYQDTGRYTVILTVTDDGGLKHSLSQTLNVNKGGGSISGKIILSATTLDNTGQNEVSESLRRFSLAENSIIEGEILVRFAASVRPQSYTHLDLNGIRLKQMRSLALDQTQLYYAEGLSAAETAQKATQLAQRPDVLYAAPNRRFYPLAVPNDPLYRYQWHYNAINLPQAWDISKGSSSTVIAVIDTGILPHPELRGRLVAGYDFITNAENAGDGDGRDTDPSDMGPGEDTGYHGTHVAGTLAANSDDGIGLAGVNWNAKLSAVRVLGKQGGSTADIIDGILWAADLHPGLINPNPADVLNLSLGGTGPCDAFYQEVFDKVIAAGKIVVVAAGNGNEDASFVAPGNCEGVITVGATNFAGSRAPYSNYGPSISIMAPGGDTTVDLNEDKFVDGVLSLWKNDNSGNFTTVFYQGTSMATPHVAGLASLMKAIKPEINQAQVIAALEATARPLSASQCAADNSDVGETDCGAGLIDANAALETIDISTPPPPPLEGLSFDPVNVNLGIDLDTAVVTLSNNLPGPLDWKVNQIMPDADNPGRFDETGITLSSSSGNLAAGSSQTISLSLDRSKATKAGDYHFEIEFISGSETRRYPLAFSVGSVAEPVVGNLESTLILACLPSNLSTCLSQPLKVIPILETGTEANYQMPDLARGQYWIIGWKDNDASKDRSAGDYFGYYSLDSRGASEISPPASGINFALEILSAADIANLDELSDLNMP